MLREGAWGRAMFDLTLRFPYQPHLHEGALHRGTCLCIRFTKALTSASTLARAGVLASSNLGKGPHPAAGGAKWASEVPGLGEGRGCLKSQGSVHFQLKEGEGTPQVIPFARAPFGDAFCSICPEIPNRLVWENFPPTACFTNSSLWLKRTQATKQLFFSQ